MAVAPESEPLMARLSAEVSAAEPCVLAALDHAGGASTVRALQDAVPQCRSIVVGMAVYGLLGRGLLRLDSRLRVLRV